MNAGQFDKFILRPTLAALEPIIPYSESARRLLLGTAAHESGGFQWIDQVTNGPDVDGPAYSVFQIERATHDDVWDSFLAFRPELAAKVHRLKIAGLDAVKQMQGNLYYATAIARLVYYRDKMPLPAANDLVSLAKYYKRVYNSTQGKATESDFMDAVDRHLAEVW